VYKKEERKEDLEIPTDMNASHHHHHLLRYKIYNTIIESNIVSISKGKQEMLK
jgi:hypothetical protein